MSHLCSTLLMPLIGGIVRQRFLLFGLGTALLIACNGSSTSDGVIPPPGIRATIPADFPEAEARVLRALAFSSEDLPPGFELQYEDAFREGSILSYVAHYFNTDLDQQDLLSGGLATADVVVAIFEDISEAERLFSLVSSMNEEELIEYSQQWQHWPADPELASLLEQVNVAARRISVGDVAAPSGGWLTIETVRERQSGDEVIFFDLSILVHRGRIVAIVALGSTQQEPAEADVVRLANEIAARISVLP